MRTLLLMRHAKSSWKDSTLADHDRPLKKRGFKAALQMGQLIRQEHLAPELILCSTAVRARQTLEELLKDCGAAPPIQELSALYHASPAAFLSVLQNVDSSLESVMVISHNPGLEQLLQEITGQAEELPTAALAVISLPIDAWSQLELNATGRLSSLWRPRDLDPV